MLRPLLVSALFAFPLIAAPARPVMPPDVVPAAYGQSSPDVATNGSEFVAIWLDERMKDRPNFSRGLAVYATRLTAQGEAIHSFGIELVPAGSWNAHIESTGRGYLVAYNTPAGAFALRLSDAASPVGAPRKIAAREVVDLATDDGTYCALISTAFAKSAAVVLAEDGTVLRTIDIDGWASSVVSVPGKYFVFTMRDGALVATIIGRDGAVSSRTVATLPAEAVVRAYSNGQRVLVSWLGRGFIDFVILDHHALPVSSPWRIAREALQYAAAAPSLAWDGGSFALMWPESRRLHGVRIASNGRLVDEEPLDVDSTALHMRGAFNGLSTMLVSSEELSDAPDPVSRVVASFSSLDDLPDPRVISFSARPHSEPDVATSGNVAMAVAVEGESWGAIAASIFAPAAPGNEIRVVVAPAQYYVYQDGPSVAAAGDLYLVVWREANSLRTRILARRVAANGALLDRQPLVVAEEGRLIANFADTDIAFDGESFLVVWHSASDEIRARRLRRDGLFVGDAITVSRTDGNRERRTPAVLWTGSAYFVVWSESLPLIGGVSPTNPLRTAYRAARITRDGTLLDTAESLRLFVVDGYSHGLALAQGKERVLLTTATGAYLTNSIWPVHALLFDPMGNALAEAPLRIDDGVAATRRMHPAAAWNGTSFLVFWNERPGEYASVLTTLRIGLDGRVAGSLPVDGATSFFPVAAPLENGALLVETAARPEQANVARLFARTYPSSTTKTRAVRH